MMVSSLNANTLMVLPNLIGCNYVALKSFFLKLGVEPQQNVFMQVIVKNALQEDRRVARYPKQASTSSSTKSPPTARPTRKQHSNEKSFMQLIYDNSLIRHKTKPEKTLHQTSPIISTTKSTKKALSKETLSTSNSATLPVDDNYFTGSTVYEKGTDNKESSQPLTFNELRVNNDPESFKRSIPTTHFQT